MPRCVPRKNWDLNGTVEIGYADNAFTAVGQRQFKTYRVHTLYRRSAWATISGSFSDRERHNNTNNNQDAVAAGDANYNGPINHVDHNRIFSAGAVLAPNEHYSVNLNYSFSDVYAATNICYSSGAAVASATTPAVPGVATVTSSGAPNLCAGDATWFARDFYGCADAVRIRSPSPTTPSKRSVRMSAIPSATSTAAASSTIPAT